MTPDLLTGLLAEAARYAPPRVAGHAQWSLTASAERAPAHLYLYDPIGAPGIEARDVVEKVRELGPRPLTVHLNSPGGDVFAGLAIYNTLRAHPAPVDVRVEGLAASIASIIAMAGATLTMARASLLMVHEPRAVVIGDARDMRQMAALLDKAGGVMADIYASGRRGDLRERVRSWMRDEKWWTAAEALEAKLIDAVDDLPVPADAVEARARFEPFLLGYRNRPGTEAPAAEEAPSSSAPRPPLERERARVLAQGFDLLMGRAAAVLAEVQVADLELEAFDPTKHPRHDKGTREGGRFREKDRGAEGVPSVATEEDARATDAATLPVHIEPGAGDWLVRHALAEAGLPASHYEDLEAIKFVEGGWDYSEDAGNIAGKYDPKVRTIFLALNNRGAANNIAVFGGGTVLHEIGHHVHLAKLTEPAAEEWALYSRRGQSARISAYARTNQGEHFAEAYRAYTKGPDTRRKLKNLEPEAYKFMAKVCRPNSPALLPPGQRADMWYWERRYNA
jgi:ATP-dependent protease ClpP protease subunit